MKTPTLFQVAQTREEFIELLGQLRRDFRENRDDWENQDLARYFEAMASWVESMDNYYLNRGESPPEDVPWRVFSDFLIAARIYE